MTIPTSKERQSLQFFSLGFHCWSSMHNSGIQKCVLLGRQDYLSLERYHQLHMAALSFFIQWCHMRPTVRCLECGWYVAGLGICSV